MGSRIECFWLEPTDRGTEHLRRYSSAPCALPHGYHTVEVEVGEVHYPQDERGLLGFGDDSVPHTDPRWPKACGCGYEFKDSDHWQYNVHRLFAGAPDGKRYTTRTMPPGAMYDASWWPEQTTDGVVLCVVLPPAGSQADHWIVDGPSKDGGKWSRSGTIPKVTVTPSILTSRYHGFLTDGFLVEC